MNRVYVAEAHDDESITLGTYSTLYNAGVFDVTVYINSGNLQLKVKEV